MKNNAQKRKKINVSIIGTQGLPNKYGGFETLVDYLSKYCPDDIKLTVYCSSKYYSKRIRHYNKAHLKYLPLDANGSMSVIYDIISIFMSFKSDKILVLGSSGGIIVPFLFGIKKKLITNVGGLDWKRSKWGIFAKFFLKLSEKLVLKGSDTIIADNKGIHDYIRNEYGLASQIIEYGGDQAYSVKPQVKDIEEFPFLKSKYAFSLARIQKDNNIELVLSSFKKHSKKKLVFVGNWLGSEYGKYVKNKYKNCPNLLLLDAIYDQRKLNLLRSNCFIYIHGHSAGGTNPALVEAMHLGLPVLAYSNGFNENTTHNKAIYFKDGNGLITSLEKIEKNDLLAIGNKMKTIANEHYVWEIVANKYYDIFYL